MLECPICYEKLGRIYRTINCGHKFHHKCLIASEKKDENIHNCPYCRCEYQNMILRERKLTPKEKEIKEIFGKDVQKYIKEVQQTVGTQEKTLLILKLYEYLIKNVSIINNKKYKLKPLKNVIITKTEDLAEQISLNVGLKNIKEKDFELFLEYKQKLFESFT